mgnify:CR=1 FL=1
MTKEQRRWVRCTIKNIAALRRVRLEPTELANHLSITNTLPDNCIRMNNAEGWCFDSCRECDKR